jgi:hypothetical protein
MKLPSMQFSPVSHHFLFLRSQHLTLRHISICTSLNVKDNVSLTKNRKNCSFMYIDVFEYQTGRQKILDQFSHMPTAFDLVMHAVLCCQTFSQIHYRVLMYVYRNDNIASGHSYQISISQISNQQFLACRQCQNYAWPTLHLLLQLHTNGTAFFPPRQGQTTGPLPPLKQTAAAS